VCLRVCSLYSSPRWLYSAVPVDSCVQYSLCIAVYKSCVDPLCTRAGAVYSVCVSVSPRFTRVLVVGTRCVCSLRVCPRCDFLVLPRLIPRLLPRLLPPSIAVEWSTHCASRVPIISYCGHRCPRGTLRYSSLDPVREQPLIPIRYSSPIIPQVPCGEGRWHFGAFATEQREKGQYISFQWSLKFENVRYLF
jgi:hypothetical protein